MASFLCVLRLCTCTGIAGALALISGESMDRKSINPQFDTSSNNITAIAGETANLPCAVAENTKGEFKLIWLNPRKTLISTDDKRCIDDSRISVERPKLADWNLMIREVRYNDSGEYMCQINTKPVLIKRIYLFVNVPPEIIESGPATNVQVIEKSTVELVCNATGVPTPVVSWYRHFVRQNTQKVYPTETDNVLGHGEVLLLQNIKRYCDGVYECVADNGIPPTATKKFEITVLFRPEVRLTSKRIGQAIGKETAFECKVSASPHATLSWKRNGTDLPSQLLQKYRMEVFDEGGHNKTLTLSIMHIEKHDFGNYTCHASNSLGQASQIMLLYEYNNKKPEIITTTRPYEYAAVTQPDDLINKKYSGKQYTAKVSAQNEFKRHKGVAMRMKTNLSVILFSTYMYLLFLFGM